MIKWTVALAAVVMVMAADAGIRRGAGAGPKIGLASLVTIEYCSAGLSPLHARPHGSSAPVDRSCAAAALV